VNTLVIILTKLLRTLGGLIGRGSSLPGKIALKIKPDILDSITYPKYVVAVTGSNGKTSTVEMIQKMLSDQGLKVIANLEGSNQIEGVTTLVLSHSSIFGKVKGDVLLIETDERFARLSFKHFHPTHYIITNLYRDQLTRNGHPEWIYNIIKDSIFEDETLILNGDDPLVSQYKTIHPDNNYYFSIDKNKYSSVTETGKYNDLKYCPVCHNLLTYSYYHYHHLGNYQCLSCGYKQEKPIVHATSIDLDEGYFKINDSYRIDLNLKSIYNIYNILSVFSLAAVLKLDLVKASNSLNDYSLRNGRVKTFKLGKSDGTLLISKHENSISYEGSMSVINEDKQDVTVMIIVDAISRKYFTSDTSWLWDIDFDMLNKPHIKQIVLSGVYSNDLATRFEYTKIDQSKIYVNSSIDDSIEYLKNNKNYLYVLTCFSDQHKFMNNKEVLK